MSSDGSNRRLQARFEDLARREEDLEPGVRQVCDGIGQMLDWLTSDHAVTPDQMRRIFDGLHELAALLEDRAAGTAQHGDPALPTGLEQFFEAFRQEAQRRVRGLSISLMGIFGGVGSDESMDQSAGHLHAIRGGAAMLGLAQVATLAQAMEQAILIRRRLDPGERDWPTRPVLRAFAILQDALESPLMHSEAEDLEGLLSQLQSSPLVKGNAPANRFAEPRQAAQSPVSPRPSDPPLEQPILVVDDVETIAASVGFVLSDLGVPIELAGDGEEALRMLKEQSYSLVISDVAMPRMDGITLTRMIRQSEVFGHLPVILLTGLDHPRERKAGMNAGANAYLIKGAIGGGELLMKVRDLLREAPVVERSVEQQPSRRILVAEDAETVAASIAFLLSQQSFEIVLAADGKEAYQRLKKAQFDLLLTDMQMPYMSGIELVRALRADQSLRELPVIMLTSEQDESTKEEAISAGVDRYLIKGEVAGGALLTAVEELITGEGESGGEGVDHRR